jgi:hypothetical protein
MLKPRKQFPSSISISKELEKLLDEILDKENRPSAKEIINRPLFDNSRFMMTKMLCYGNDVAAALHKQNAESS